MRVNFEPVIALVVAYALIVMVSFLVTVQLTVRAVKHWRKKR